MTSASDIELIYTQQNQSKMFWAKMSQGYEYYAGITLNSEIWKIVVYYVQWALSIP